MSTSGKLYAFPLAILAVALGALATTRAERGAEYSHSESPDRRLSDPLVDEAHAALLEQESRHERRFSEAIDPVAAEEALQERLRMAIEADIQEEIVKAGFELFVRDRGVSRKRKPAVESNRCQSCHSRLGPGGAGGLVDNYFDGRNPPALRGAALLERLAEEMTKELKADAAAGRALEAKGISFAGEGSVGSDLRVKPFGRGRWATLDEAITVMGQKTMGLDLTPAERIGLRAWIATLPPPGLQPPDAARTLDLYERFVLGRKEFSKLGCATCHVPELTLDDGTTVAAYTDLRFHDMGTEFAGKDARRWQTAPLWGLSGSAPYLHDGSALASLDEAILAHGGEAAASAKAYEKLSIDERGVLKVFLLSLAPAPKIQIAGQ